MPRRVRGEAVRLDRHQRHREACTRDGFNIERSEVRLPAGPLRMLGEHLISLHLHADIDVPLHVTIVAEE